MMNSFKKGDRIKYTGTYTPMMTGKFGTVGAVGLNGIITAVKWDDGSVLCPMHSNVTLVGGEQSEINNALAVLKKYGKVEFKKNKPPFVNKKVHLNSSYNAEVTDKWIIVGCQAIPFAAIDELAEAVAIARKYNEEK